jgi:hypothetical protein
VIRTRERQTHAGPGKDTVGMVTTNLLLLYSHSSKSQASSILKRNGLS